MNPFKASQNTSLLKPLAKIRSSNMQIQRRGLEELAGNRHLLAESLGSVNDILVELFRGENDLKEASSGVLQCFVQEYGRQHFLEAISEWMLYAVDIGKSKHRLLKESVHFCEICDYLVKRLDFKEQRRLSLMLSYELVRRAPGLEPEKAQDVIRSVTDKILGMRLCSDDLQPFLRIASMHPNASVFREFYSGQLKYLPGNDENILDLKWSIALELEAFDEAEFKKDSIHIRKEVFARLLKHCKAPETVTAGTEEAYTLVYNASSDKRLCVIHFINHGAIESVDKIESLKITDYSVMKECEYSRVNYLIQRFLIQEWTYVGLPENLKEYFIMHNNKVKVPISKESVLLPSNCTDSLFFENVTGVKEIVRAAMFRRHLNPEGFTTEEIAQALPLSAFVFSYEYFSANHLDMLAEGKFLGQLLEMYYIYPNLVDEDVVFRFLKKEYFGVMSLVSPDNRCFTKRVAKELDGRAVIRNIKSIPDAFKLDFYAPAYKEVCCLVHENDMHTDGVSRLSLVGSKSFCSKEHVNIIDCMSDPEKYFYERLLEHVDRGLYSHVFGLHNFDYDLFYENACLTIRDLELPTLKYTDEYFYMNSYFYEHISLEERNLDFLSGICRAHNNRSPQGLFFTFVLQSILGHTVSLNFYINRRVIYLGQLLGHKKHFVLKSLIDCYGQGQIDKEEILLFKDSLVSEYLDGTEHSENQDFSTFKKAYISVKSRSVDASIFEITNPRVVDLVMRECSDVHLWYVFRSDFRLLNKETRTTVCKRLFEIVSHNEDIIPQILQWTEDLEDDLLNLICERISEMMFNNYNLTRFDTEAIDSEIFDIFIEPIRGTHLFWKVFLMSVNKVRNINFLLFAERCLKNCATLEELAACLKSEKTPPDAQCLRVENRFLSTCVYFDADGSVAGYSDRLLLVLRLLYFNFPVLYRNTFGIEVNIDDLLVKESESTVIQGVKSRFIKITEGYQLKFTYRRDDVEYDGFITYKNQVPSFKTCFQPRSLLTLKIAELLRKSYKFMEILSMWKVEVDNKISGFNECPICYLVLDEQGGFPSLKCRTCRSAYHKSCFFLWKNKIKKSECAICRQPIET